METGGPELVGAAPLRARPGAPVGRVVLAPGPDPSAPAFYEWRLDAQSWSDEHPHDEYVFVIDGELHVTAAGRTVVAGPGSLVRVPARQRGTYAAPRYARLLSVYGPRPPGPVGDPRGELRPLAGPDRRV